MGEPVGSTRCFCKDPESQILELELLGLCVCAAFKIGSVYYSVITDLRGALLFFFFFQSHEKLMSNCLAAIFRTHLG